MSLYMYTAGSEATVRLSVDVRYQPEAHPTDDARFFGVRPSNSTGRCNHESTVVHHTVCMGIHGGYSMWVTDDAMQVAATGICRAPDLWAARFTHPSPPHGNTHHSVYVCGVRYLTLRGWCGEVLAADRMESGSESE